MSSARPPFLPRASIALAFTSFLWSACISCWRLASWSATCLSRSSSACLSPWHASTQPFITICFRAGALAPASFAAYFARRSSWCLASLSTCFSRALTWLLCADSILARLHQEEMTIFWRPRWSPMMKRFIASLAAVCFLRPSRFSSLKRFQAAKTLDLRPASSPPNNFLSIISVVDFAWSLRSLSMESLSAIAFSCSAASCLCRSSHCLFSISARASSDFVCLRPRTRVCQPENAIWMTALVSPIIERRSAALTELRLSAVSFDFCTHCVHSAKTLFCSPLASPICHFRMVDSTALKASAFSRSASACALLSCAW
mmetsp:Transcript_10988/g.32474  ORF Transcript_10988/g.32474 Transcript_10988/m.32474 type:complete len:316 (-) Transcript_10988:232-1179(-)